MGGELHALKFSSDVPRMCLFGEIFNAGVKFTCGSENRFGLRLAVGLPDTFTCSAASITPSGSLNATLLFGPRIARISPVTSKTIGMGQSWPFARRMLEQVPS